MADQKLTQLTAITAVTSDDLLYVVDDPSGTAISKKITAADLSGSLLDVDGNSNDVYRVDGAGVSDFVATIASVSGSTLVYNAPSSGNEASIKPTSSSQLAKLRLYNTSNAPVDYLLVSSVDTATNTITFTSAVPGTWTAGETITSRSQTNTDTTSSAYFQDIEITSGCTDKNALIFNTAIIDTAGAGKVFAIHPFETYTAAKVTQTVTQTTSALNGLALIKITNNTFCIRWTSGGSTIILLRLSACLL